MMIKIKQWLKLVTASVVLGHVFVANAQLNIIKVGSEGVDGYRLQPFTAKWNQYGISGGEKNLTGTYEESLVISKDESEQLIHTQIVDNFNGVIVTNTTVFDRKTMKPLSINQFLDGVPEGAANSQDFVFTDAQYEVTVKNPEGKERKRTVHMPVDMFNVGNLGLVFAAMQLEMGKTIRMPSTFPQYQDGQFWLDATVTGETEYQGNEGEVIPVWQVDIRWINIKDGDEYPAGPDQSGGAYYVAKDISKGVTPVPAYVNDTLIIELSNPDS